MAKRISISRLTEKYQATVPAPIRKILKLHKGENIAFEIMDDETIVVRKAGKVDLSWAKALEGSLSEWNSKFDDEAYEDL